MVGWVRQAVLAKVDPAKMVKPDASQELADKRAEAMMKLATLAAAGTCGRKPADVKAAYSGAATPEPDNASNDGESAKKGWFDRAMGSRRLWCE